MKKEKTISWLSAILGIILGVLIGMILGFCFCIEGIATILDHIQIDNVDIDLNETKLSEVATPILYGLLKADGFIQEEFEK